jgi:manganese/zinc/iron transport system permease protein
MPEWLQIFVPSGDIGEGWILAVAMMTNVACGVIGCYLVLRRMSLMGDAISHAVLPGLVIAFLFTGSLNIGGMFVGAFIVGLLTTFLTQALHRLGGVPADASMGVVFTSLFAIGVVLLRRYAGNVDLDPDCVLQGQLTLMPNIRVEVFGLSIPRAALSIGAVLIANVIFVGLLWKELKITSFDPALATTMGLRSGLIHYLLMAMVAGTTVASFEAVGSILVIAMLIVPGATAHLLTDRLSRMLMIAAAVAALSGYVGFSAARWNGNVEPAGMIAVASGVLFFLAVFFSPRYGIVSTLWRNLQTSSRILREDILAMLYRLEELGDARPMPRDEAARAVGGGVAAIVSSSVCTVVCGSPMLAASGPSTSSARTGCGRRIWSSISACRSIMSTPPPSGWSITLATNFSARSPKSSRKKLPIPTAAKFRASCWPCAGHCSPHTPCAVQRHTECACYITATTANLCAARR